MSTQKNTIIGVREIFSFREISDDMDGQGIKKHSPKMIDTLNVELDFAQKF